jgi:hypothetical protein
MLIRSWARSQLLTPFFLRSYIDWPISKTFGTMPPMEAPLWTPVAEKKQMYFINFTFSVYIHTWELKFGQTILYKTQVLLGTFWGMHLQTLWELENHLRIWWEHIGNKEKISFPLTLEKKKLDPSWGHAEPSDWLHEISLSKTLHTNFLPRLMAGAKFWGHIK